MAALDVFARRIAGFDNAAVERTKALLDWASLPADEEFGPGLAAFFQTSGFQTSGFQTSGFQTSGFQTSGFQTSGFQTSGRTENAARVM
jgi:hypothetical protein